MEPKAVPRVSSEDHGDHCADGALFVRLILGVVLPDCGVPFCPEFRVFGSSGILALKHTESIQDTTLASQNCEFLSHPTLTQAILGDAVLLRNSGSCGTSPYVFETATRNASWHRRPFIWAQRTAQKRGQLASPGARPRKEDN